MRNFFSIIIIFAILLVGGGWVYMRQQEERTRAKIAEDLASARRTFAHKARSASSEADDEAYARSIKAALKTYDEELSRKVFRDHKELRDPAKFKATVEKKLEKGEIDEARRKSQLEGYDIVKEAYDTLMAANWRPVLTQKGSADTRLDIYDVKKTVDGEGRPILEAKFFFWGIEDNTLTNWGQMSFRLWKKEMEEVKEGRQMVKKEVDKVLGNAEGEAQPHIILQSPAKYIEDFPSYVSIGFLWMPLFPHEAETVDISYDYKTKILGGSETASALKWEKFKIPDSWKLGAGQQWEADEVEATEDEIAGRPPQEEGAEKKATP